MILIAVALFAALSFAVLSTDRGSGNINAEKIELLASEIMQYGVTLQQTVMRLTLSRGCGDTEFSFHSIHFTNPGYYVNSMARSDGSCHIFGPNGGQVPWVAPPQAIQDEFGVSEFAIVINPRIHGVGNDGITDDEVLYVTYVSREVCLHMNEKLGVTNPSGEPPYAPNEGFAIPPLNWQVYGANRCTPASQCTIGGVVVGSAGSAPQLSAKHAGCYEAGNGHYHYYQVLYVR